MNGYCKHGMSKSRIYRVYYGILDRCNNPNNKSYKHYGGRGIKCLWRNFSSFHQDMYSTYRDGLEIDRIDVNGHYSKSNCRWATRTEQMNNYRGNTIIKYGDEQFTLTEFAKKYHLNRHTLKQRVAAGISGEDLLCRTNLPKQCRGENRSRLVRGKTIKEIASDLGVSSTAVLYRINKFGVERAINDTPAPNHGKFIAKHTYMIDGVALTLRDIAELYDIKYSTLWRRVVSRRMLLEDALRK